MGAVAGWEIRLRRLLEEWRDVPFIWGDRDCLTLCRAGELAMTGVSRFADLPVYRSEKEAARQLRRLGFVTVEALVDDRLSGCAVPQAQRGEWVMRDTVGLAAGAFGLVVGRNAAFMGETGLMYLPVTIARRAWRIT